jgi:segregation and condensation protein A
MVYDVHLDTFEGPLDLLLHLIKKNDLEINEIKIAEITAEYLTYLDLMQELNIDVVGEFLVMASTLVQIKAKTLILSNDGNDILENDSLNFLKNRLLEYQKYKELGKLLSYKIIENSRVYYRSALPVNKQDFVLDATIFDLMCSFRTVLTTLPENVKEIIYQEIPIETKIMEILDVLEEREYVSFNEISRVQKTKVALIVCFMAVLELVKNKQIVAKQSELFSEIRIYRIYNKIDPEPEEDNKYVFKFVEKGDKQKQLSQESVASGLELISKTDMLREEDDENI